jgi:hypothetical protein
MWIINTNMYELSHKIWPSKYNIHDLPCRTLLSSNIGSVVSAVSEPCKPCSLVLRMQRATSVHCDVCARC